MPDINSYVKQQLFDICTAYVNSRIAGIEQAIAASQQASVDDTKSSAGDKYETTREMMQQETNRNTIQLAEAGKMRTMLNRVKPKSEALTAAGPGSLVITSEGNFYIAVGAGNYVIDGITYHTISSASPIALAMQKLSAGNAFNFKGKKVVINAIY